MNTKGTYVRRLFKRALTLALMSVIFGCAGVRAAEVKTESDLLSAIGGTATEITIQGTIELENTVVIPAGRTVTLSGSGTLDGGKIAGGTILSIGGNVTIADGLTITGAKVTAAPASGSIADKEAAGTGAVVIKDGKLTLAGGLITGNRVCSDYCGTVYVGSGGQILIENGAKIMGNTAADDSGKYIFDCASAGLFLYGGSQGTMSGGEISNNKGMRGSALMLYSHSYDENEQAEFTLQGGDIHHNESKSDKSLEASGAVHVQGNASLIMQESTAPDGTVVVPKIRNNIAYGVNEGRVYYNFAQGKVDTTQWTWRSAVGGGICVFDPSFSNISGLDKEFKTKFVMNGGEILNNEAVTGGGIYSFSNGVELNAGTISGNKANRLVPTIENNIYGYVYSNNNLSEGVGGMGGGVYVEGNRDFYSIIKIRDAVIEDNTAYFMGGGVWFCPTGLGDFKPYRGTLIHGNRAEGYTNLSKKPSNRNSGAGDDVLYGGDIDDIPTIPVGTPSLSLSDQALGGYDAEWYMDGFVRSTLTPGSMGKLPHNGSINRKYPGLQHRYTENSSENTKVSGSRNVYCYTDQYSSVSSTQEFGYALKCVMNADDLAASRELGKLFITGNTATYGGGIGANGGVRSGEPGVNILISKAWVKDNPAERPQSVDVQVYKDDELIRTVTLTAAEDWKTTLTNLSAGTYGFVEMAPGGYIEQIEVFGKSDIDGDMLRVNLTNTRMNVQDLIPQTGDHSTLWPWIAGLYACCVGLSTIAVRRKRKY